MFNNFINSNKGRTTTKILATLLVITLTFANFAMLGAFLLESIAIEKNLGEQSTNTNSEHVKFNVYLDSSDISVKEVSRDINTEDLELYVSVSVTGKGKLEKGAIDFSNSNFKSKENEKVFKRDIETISSQKGITIKLPIVARKDSSFDLSLLNMISKIKLTGEYINENGNIEHIDSEKEIKINWTTEGITKEQIKISQEIITNKIYKINGTNKRVLQLLVKTNVEDNKVPVKSTKIEISNPIAELLPEQVKVTTYSTAATNGGSSTEFNSNQGSAWNYNSDENKTYIELTNITDGNISWQKNATDELIVTYIYDEQANIESISSDVKVFVVVYGNENTAIEQTNNLTLESVEEKGNIIDIQNYISKEIYKGKMNIGQDTEYKTKSDIFVSYIAPESKISIKDGETINSENLSTYYKTTLINKKQAINVLGNTGTIKICKEDGSIISEIVLSQENSEEYFTVNYSENVSNIVIETSAPVKEGKIEIINTKAINVLKLEKIEEATTVESKTELKVTNLQNEIMVNSTKTAAANLLEPTTSVDVKLNKTTISNQVEEEISITAVLNTNNNSNKLFDNPTINIELPQEISEAALLQDVSLLYEDELKIKSSGIETNENGNKVISIVLEGKQTKYEASANIVIYLKVKANPFMENKDVEIKTACINGEEKVNKSAKVSIVSKEGILSKNSIIIGENKQETINNTVTTTITKNSDIKINSTIINNNGEKITNTVLTGNIPEGTILKEQLTTNLNNVSIYYATKQNPSAEEWVNTIEDYKTVKAFKIEIGELEQASSLEIAYTLQSTEQGLKEKDSFESKVNIGYVLEEQAKQDDIIFKVLNPVKCSEGAITADSEKILVEVIPTIGGESAKNITEINNGQTITYNVKVTNISNEPINNLIIKVDIENGVFYELVEDGGTILDTQKGEMVNTHSYKEIEEGDGKGLLKEVLNPGEISQFRYQVVSYIGTETNANIFKNNILIKADNMEELSVNDQKTIKQADIALKIHSNRNEDPILYSNGKIETYEIELINLTQNNLKNIPINIELPQEFTCDAQKQEYFNKEDGTFGVEGNNIKISINELKSSENKKIYVRLETESISMEERTREILLVATSDHNGKPYWSNEYTKMMNQAETKLDVEFTSNKEGQILCLETEDIITYTLKLTNKGILATGNLYIVDEIPYELELMKIIAQVNNGETKEYEPTEDNNVCIDDLGLEPGESLTINITAMIDGIDEESQEIVNKIYIDSFTVNKIEKELTNKVKIEADVQDEPGTPNEPNEPVKPDNPDEPEQKTYSINGVAWLDQNKNGIRDNNENILQGIKVILLNKNGEIVKDSEGKEISTITTITGTYKFNNIPKGEYIVAFIYDTNKYTVSKYQVQDVVEEKNSDVISKEMSINNETVLVGATDIIKIENIDIQNIDIGLVENAKFDLSLEKYVAKVIVTNNKESAVYEFNEENLAKVEIPAKELEKSSILVQYQIKISNEGDIQAYANDVVDYLPKELTFNSEMNPDWYSDSKGNLHNKVLEKEPIEAGKSKTISLVLTKTLTNNSLGTIENLAEIEKCTNLQGISELDSIAGNKKDGEDDIGKASLIISIKTGTPVMYIGIIIGSMAILGLAIYLINKKVLRENI